MIRKVKNDPVEDKVYRNREIKAPLIIDCGPFFSGQKDISADQINIGKRCTDRPLRKLWFAKNLPEAFRDLKDRPFVQRLYKFKILQKLLRTRADTLPSVSA